MNAANRNNFPDWALGALMFLLCAVLTILQYRWTGEVARAEMISQRSQLDDQAHAFTRSFDTELDASTALIFPSATEFEKKGIEAVHLAHFKKWNASHPRPVFRRLGIAVNSGDALQLSLFDPKTDRLVRTNWPADWAVLQENLENKHMGRSPPFRDSSGLLQEYPQFPKSRNNHEPNMGEHWVILELDLAYAQTVWLPELTAKYLNPDGETNNVVRVKGMVAPFVDIYASATNRLLAAKPAISVRFNAQGRNGNMSGAPSGTDRGERGVWMLEVLPRPGALEATVAAARNRNLLVSIGISLLMFATGIVLVRNTRRARQLAEQQMNFVANVSHELRTPLTVIHGAAYNIRRGLVQERAKIEQYSGLIIQHTEQLTEMIEQLLELAGARKNQAPLSRKPVALADVLKEAIAGAEPDTRVAECVVESTVPSTLPEINGDPAALRRVFQNLIANAAKHGGEGRWIGITANLTNGGAPPMVEVRVSDHGPGIPEDEQPEVFKPFVRGAAAGERQIRGSGLGLSLVKEIVEAHGGQVSLHSQPGQGATFLVQLPVTSAKPA